MGLPGAGLALLLLLLLLLLRSAPLCKQLSSHRLVCLHEGAAERGGGGSWPPPLGRFCEGFFSV